MTAGPDLASMVLECLGEQTRTPAELVSIVSQRTGLPRVALEARIERLSETPGSGIQRDPMGYRAAPKPAPTSPVLLEEDGTINPIPLLRWLDRQGGVSTTAAANRLGLSRIHLGRVLQGLRESGHLTGGSTLWLVTRKGQRGCSSTTPTDQSTLEVESRGAGDARAPEEAPPPTAGGVPPDETSGETQGARSSPGAAGDSSTRDVDPGSPTPSSSHPGLTPVLSETLALLQEAGPRGLSTTELSQLTGKHSRTCHYRMSCLIKLGLATPSGHVSARRYHFTPTTTDPIQDEGTRDRSAVGVSSAPSSGSPWSISKTPSSCEVEPEGRSTSPHPPPPRGRASGDTERALEAGGGLPWDHRSLVESVEGAVYRWARGLSPRAASLVSCHDLEALVDQLVARLEASR